MDIIISDNWLREFLETKATPKQIAECVSLCGPSIEKLEEKDGDTLYHAEITTNRIDCVGVYGFAREVAAILPRFGIKVKLKKILSSASRSGINIDSRRSLPRLLRGGNDKARNLPFTIVSNNKLVKRTLGIVLTNIKYWETPAWMKKRLTSCGMRSLNAVVDITNYVMLETGHPCHAFDYDKIKNKKFIIRESKKGEKVTSFDEKTYTLSGGDIVFDDGDGKIIDLPGIIGTKNSVVNKDTKRVFFFVDNNDPSRIRNTSMRYAIRTMAASINEKGVDPELGEIALLRGVELYKLICKADVASRLFDEYPFPFKIKSVKTDKSFIDQSLGIEVSKDDISQYLSALEFKPKWQGNNLTVWVPSHRANDINIPEDLVEEIARIYGYHNLPSKLMNGDLPDPLYNSPFQLEWKIKNVLKSLEGFEVYTLSLVPKKYIEEVGSLKLKNPLGSETEYLRTNLSGSLVESVRSNAGNYDKLFLFEMANIYIPNDKDLPNEKMTLGMCFDGYRFIEVKGVIETLLDNELHIDIDLVKSNVGQDIFIKSGSTLMGRIIEREDGMFVSEIEVEKLQLLYKKFRSFKPLPKHPSQIEDLTVKIPAGVEVGKVMQTIRTTSGLVSEIELRDVYKESYTFRISYQDPEKTLTDKEVEDVRNEILRNIKDIFGMSN